MKSAATVLLFVLFNTLQAVAQNDMAVARRETVTTNQAETASDDEKLVRDTYRKLEIYSRAAELSKMNGVTANVRDDSVLNFKLSNFHSGPIDDIKSVRQRELITERSGQVLEIGQGVHVEDGFETAYYEPYWADYKAFPDQRPDSSIGDILSLNASQTFDVQRYTSYEVTISFEGRTRSYRALVMHHAAVGPQLRHPTFWDSVAGSMLNEVFEEKRPPFGTKKLSVPN
jgi:hypothetical protein